MEHLMNVAFYSFLLSQCNIASQYYARVFDWIPVQERMQLAKLLDAWKAAEMRLTWMQNNRTDFSSDAIDHTSQEEAEYRQLFDLTLKNAYQKAEKMWDVNAKYGVENAPEPDLEFWRQACNRELYEARLAAGEPVVFYKGRCCLYGFLGGYRCAVVPGPYPGLRYYHFYDNTYTSAEEHLWKMTYKGRGSDLRMWEEPIPIGYGAIPCHVKRQRLLEKGNIIGPATYAEFVNQHGLSHAIDLAEEY